ncbi:MAG: hypothetical protein WD025_05380 [Bacteriovoracaceae bacterium]
MASASIEEIGKSLSQKTVVSALAERIDDKAVSELRNLSFIENVLIEKENDFQRIKIYADSLEDRRSFVSEFMVKRGLGLLEMNQEKPDLEKIFLEVTQRGKR